jgi:hypothetical protein
MPSDFNWTRCYDGDLGMIPNGDVSGPGVSFAHSRAFFDCRLIPVRLLEAFLVQDGWSQSW